LRKFIFLVSLLFLAITRGFANPVTHFVENRGQWHADVLFKASIPGGDLYVLKNKLKYVFYEKNQKGHHHGVFDEAGSDLKSASAAPDDPGLQQAVEVEFAAANPGSRITGENIYFSRINFIKHTGRASAGIRSFSKVKVADLYSGIDLIIYANEAGIKYDLVVGVGADPAIIKMKYEGQNSMFVRDGRLSINTIFGQFNENPPLVYQMDDQKQATVQAAFYVDSNEVGFALPNGYDAGKELVIDPELIFSTYSGSTADNWGFTATYDDDGNLYSGGIVLSSGYPVTNGVFQPIHAGEWDVGILKYDPTGKNLVWATYLGGSFSETPQSIIVNSKGELVIYGTTSSPDFPMTATAFNSTFLGGDPIIDTAGVAPRLVGGISMRNGTDIFLAKLSADGSTLTGATLIGGTENDGIMERLTPLVKNYGDQFRGEVNLDKDDNIYVASNTSSPDFLIKNGANSVYGGDLSDGVVMKFNEDLTELVWSSYVGGSGVDALYSVKVDIDGHVFVAGGSNSVDFPVSANAIKPQKPDASDIDGVVAKLKNDGTEILSSTYLGTSAYDQVYFLELDSSNQAYVLGQTQGNYPVSEGVYANANSGQFVHKLSNELDSTFYTTTIGSGRGSPDFSPTAFLVNECENIFICGWGGNLNNPGLGYNGGSTIGLPTTGNAFQTQTDGTDFYLMVLLQDAKQLLYGTFFGEFNGRGEHVDGGTSRFDKRGIVYQSVCGGCGGSSGFPTWPPDVWSTTNNSTNCNNAAFKFDLAALLARFETDTEDFTNRGIREGCYPLTVVFLNESLGGEEFLWDFGEGTLTDQDDSISITYETPGSYPVLLTATDINTCVRESTARGTITVFDYEFGIMPDDSICYGESIVLNARGGVQYDWIPKASLQNSNTSTPVASPDTTTLYSVDIIDINGCTWEDSLEIKVIPGIIADFDYEIAYDCFQGPTITFTNKSENASTFLWEFGDGTSSEAFDVQHKYAESDSLQAYEVVLTSRSSFCSESKSVSISAVTPFVPNFISPNNDGKNDVFEVRVAGSVDLNIYNRWGRPVFQADDYQNDWGPKDLASGVYYYEIIFSDLNTRCNGWLQVMH
jgi:gliding motility-associated-like protein